MNRRFKFKVIASMVALALPGAALYAANEGNREAAQSPAVEARDKSGSHLYRETWSAEQMTDTAVRGEAGDQIGEVKDIIVGRDGTISKVVVEVGGFLEIGDQHIGVPWKDVRIGPDMQWIEVPLREVEGGTYSLYGHTPQGEEVKAGAGSWRVNELIGDFASLEDFPRYGRVRDVIFSKEGKAQAVIVDRAAGRWGGYGPYAYPFPHGGYDRRGYDYRLPYTTADVNRFERFDYVRLGELSRFANDRGGPADPSVAQQPAR